MSVKCKKEMSQAYFRLPNIIEPSYKIIFVRAFSMQSQCSYSQSFFVFYSFALFAHVFVLSGVFCTVLPIIYIIHLFTHDKKRFAHCKKCKIATF